jgi:hypothetical protein
MKLTAEENLAADWVDIVETQGVVVDLSVELRARMKSHVKQPGLVDCINYGAIAPIAEVHAPM